VCPLGARPVSQEVRTREIINLAASSKTSLGSFLSVSLLSKMLSAFHRLQGSPIFVLARRIKLSGRHRLLSIIWVVPEH